MSSIERLFPALAGNAYRITSPSTAGYNCIAWAAGDDSSWWEPDPFGLYAWPVSAAREYTLDAYVNAYASLGYVKCEDGRAEPGAEKVAIFVDATGRPTHAARQLPTGKWTSKLGQREDIEHDQLAGVAGAQYGTVAQYLKRSSAPLILKKPAPSEKPWLLILRLLRLKK